VWRSTAEQILHIHQLLETKRGHSETEHRLFTAKATVEYFCLIFESPGFKSRPGDQLSYPEDFVVLLLISSSRKMLEHSLKLYSYHFLKCPFQFGD
jgi:hypothetical protein